MPVWNKNAFFLLTLLPSFPKKKKSEPTRLFFYIKERKKENQPNRSRSEALSSFSVFSFPLLLSSLSPFSLREIGCSLSLSPPSTLAEDDCGLYSRALTELSSQLAEKRSLERSVSYTS